MSFQLASFQLSLLQALADKRAAVDTTGWQLVVTGHSLGAGAAALVALYAHNYFPRCAAACSLLLEQNPCGSVLQPKATCRSMTEPEDPASNCAYMCYAGAMVTICRHLSLFAICKRRHFVLAARRRVKCWAFEPPGGMMTRVVSRALQPLCTSTALGKDWIPRLSVSSFERMRDDMVGLCALKGCSA